jgi:hypothetical protein
MNTTDIVFSVVAGVLATPVASLVKRSHWSPNVKYVAALATSFVAAALVLLLRGDAWTATNVGEWLAAVVATSQTFYQLYFSHTELEDRLTSVGS